MAGKLHPDRGGASRHR